MDWVGLTRNHFLFKKICLYNKNIQFNNTPNFWIKWFSRFWELKIDFGRLSTEFTRFVLAIYPFDTIDIQYNPNIQKLMVETATSTQTGIPKFYHIDEAWLYITKRKWEIIETDNMTKESPQDESAIVYVRHHVPST